MSGVAADLINKKPFPNFFENGFFISKGIWDIIFSSS